MIDALDACAGATGNVVYRNAVYKVKEDVSTGQQLQFAMRATGVFPAMALQMTAIGEESGALDAMLEKVAIYYEDEVDNAVDGLTSMMEPLIMSVLGVLIGGLIIAMYLPIFQLGSGVLAGLCAWHFGYGPWLAFTLFATWTLLAAAMIDADTTLLPDSMTFPLLWAALLAALLGVSPVSLPDAVAGAMAGYLSLWSVYWLFKLLTGKEGMGYGDFKLLAALGAWAGWQYLPLIILLSSVVGLVFTLIATLFGGEKRTQIPFGPYLAAAGWIALLWGDTIVSSYLGMFKIS